MTFKRGLLLFVLFFSGAVSMQAAFAQSSFAGSWGGTITGSSSASCTCSGACGGYVTPAASCNFTEQWTGSADSAGNFTETDGPGTVNCSDGSSNAFPAGSPDPIGQIAGDGTLSVPAYNYNSSDAYCTTTQNCPASAYHFSSSAVSGTFSCSGTSTCTFADPNGGYTVSCTFGSQGSLTGTKGAGSNVLVPSQPVFPMTVNSNITPTVATVTAQVSPPSQLVGTSGSVFVFAHVRQSKLSGLLKSAADEPRTQKDGPTPDPCVLAQLGSGGQLTAVSGSSLAPYSSGLLTSQSQAVNVLNNVPTSNVSGASLFVGYGSNSSSMISGGTYQGAVTVNGDASSCSAALLTGAAPNTPSALSGLWWNASESGWGISLTQRRNILFGAWFTYDGVGAAKWYVASSCALPNGVTGTSGTCNGTLFQVSGPTFFGTQFNSALVQAVPAGNLSVAFSNANNATMSYTVNGQSRTVPITRQLFASGSTQPAVDYTDLWWNPNESGWGMSMTQQYGVIFIAWYVYDNQGKPVWYVANNCVVVGSSCSGNLLSVTGPPFGPTFNSAAVQASVVGSINVTFLDANNGAFSYTVNGISGTKSITRQTF